MGSLEIVNVKKIPERLSLLVNNNSDLLKENDKACIIYLFVTSLTRADGTPIIKIGFTTNIYSRYESLKREYQCEFYLISVIKDTTLMDEINFHNFLRSQRNIVPHKCVINGVLRKELYCYTKEIHDMFLSYPSIKDDINKNADKKANINKVQNDIGGKMEAQKLDANKSKVVSDEMQNNKEKTKTVDPYLHTKRRAQCEFCEAKFTTKYNLRRHYAKCSLKSKIDDLINQNKIKRQENMILYTQLNDANATINNLRDEIHKTVCDNDKLINDLRIELRNELHKEVCNKNKQIDDLRNEIIKLQIESHKKDKQVNDLYNDASEHAFTIANLRSELLDKQEIINNANDDIEKISNKCTTKSKKLEKMNDRLCEYQKMIDVKNVHVTELLNRYSADQKYVNFLEEIIRKNDLQLDEDQ